MLHELHIQNYAVIDSLSLEFHPGLNLLSGETGSGKSILVDALGLALGGRASPEVIRTGADRVTITAVFRFTSAAGKRRHPGSVRAEPESPPWADWFEEYGLAGGSEPEAILRREIHSNGRSRLLMNDQPVTAAAIRALARQLVEVHGQNEHVALLSPEAQLDLLDQFAGLEATVAQVGQLFKRFRDLESEMESLTENEQGRLQAIDVLSFQIQEVEHAQLQAAEDSKLENERHILANLEKVRAVAAGAFAQLYEEEESASSKLAGVARALDELRRYDPQFDPYLEPLTAARATLEDLAFFLRDYPGRLESDPGRLEEVEDRLALIDRLKRKYGSTIGEILEFAERCRQQLSNLVHADERRDRLRAELERAAKEYQSAAEELSEQRRTAARRLASLVREELGQLGMEKTRFEVRFDIARTTLDRPDGSVSAEIPSSPIQGGARGIDLIELRISPNPGEDPRPLEKIASGGELSRLMLALKTVVGTARGLRSAAPGVSFRLAATFIFDEVDSGIGGRVAEQVGQRLKRLSRQTQVLCVTHLPQIACFADHHFYVEKLQRGGRTVTAVRHLDSPKDRAQELARMLSGSQITEAVLEHAATMLKQAEALS